MSEGTESTETLPDPVSTVLDDTVDEARINRIWAGMEARPRETGVSPAVWAVPVIAAAAAVALFWAWPRDSAPDAPTTPASLMLASGDALGEVRTEGEPVTVALADGSRLVLAPDSVISPVQNDGTTIRWRLARGEARFEVRPHGPRRWVVDGGEATATVLGTVFTVRREPGWTEVDVERGRVQVDAASGSWTLTRGERRAVGQRAEPSAGPASAEGEGDALASAAGALPAERAAAGPLAERPSRAEAPTAEPSVREQPGRPAPRSAAELLQAADRAREAGDAEEAIGLLRRAAEMGDADAALAAFTLGRMLSARSPADAARAFQRALELPLPVRLAEDAAARQVDAFAAAGDVSSAREAAAAYLARYPDGRHTARVREHLESP